MLRRRSSASSSRRCIVVSIAKFTFEGKGRRRRAADVKPQEVVSGGTGETRPNSPPELRSACTNRSNLRAEPWTRSPVSMSSISIILRLLRPKSLMACTRNLPSQMNHDTTN